MVRRMSICRVPLAGTEGCSSRVAKERAPLPVGSNGPYFKLMTYDRPAAQQLNLTGVLTILGFPTKFTSSLLAAQGRQAVADGHLTTVKVIGASDFYNDYVTGYMMLIEKETPTNPMPNRPKLPPCRHSSRRTSPGWPTCGVGPCLTSSSGGQRRSHPR